MATDALQGTKNLIRSQTQLLGTLKLAAIATQLDGEVIFWNRSAEELYGWVAAEVIGRNIMEITVPGEVAESAAAIMASVAAGRSWTGEFKVKRNDGAYFTASVTNTPIVDETGVPIGILGVSHDLTTRQQFEEAQRSSDEDFRSLANSLPELCWMARGDGHIFWYNERWYEYTGTTPDQMEGWGWQSVHEPKILPAVLERWKSSIQTGHPFEMKFPLLGSDGRFRWFLTRVRPVRDRNGQIIRWFGVNTNIDEEVKVREALNEARKELEQRVHERTAELNAANENLRELSGRLLQMRDEESKRLALDLHDSVGQLVAAIGMNMSMVKTQSHKLDPAGVKAVDENLTLVQEVSREIRTISHLLHPPLLDEAGLAFALRWYVEGFSERSRIAVDLRIPSDFARLRDDLEIAMFRIVQECLTNIHRHSGSPTAVISIRQEDSRVLVEVQDRGTGIPLEKQPQLKSTARAGVGFRGIRERVRQLGGTLEIQSDKNGTLVKATLPLKHSTHAPASTEAV